MKITDGGPIYTETYAGEWLIEPWNAISSLLYLIPAGYWFVRMRRERRQSRMLSVAILLLFLGGIGSTLFHGFRSHSLFLLLDVLPIQILTLAITVFFWFRVLNSAWLTFAVAAFVVAARFALFAVLDSTLAINLTYLLNGIFLFLPVIIYLKKTEFRQGKYIAASVLLFMISLVFRQLDPYSGEVLEMGTHWLWHLFSAAGSGFLGAYFYKERL